MKKGIVTKHQIKTSQFRRIIVIKKKDIKYEKRTCKFTIQLY